ncbi:hypothetical protein SNOG_13868 [Parastagonospora nodorum SN15]|uniref:Uncharacterized protein n=1 Tax=Phaeosphaeria nodorum (strain SN15 / ATCC MYA-4574 / FGSC 10173) TaxID=321614 RepID=Q0U2Z6_PHANO|nr:hypothetical protein SNOG_13868 [Parastagonospora nodorum SN15]EAT78892.1 hypothetical protein SNOG_13868 [Parastagonospora nodorum SN15]
MVVTKALTKAQDGGAQAEQRQWPGMVISGVEAQQEPNQDQVACTVCGPCPEDAAGRPYATPKPAGAQGTAIWRYWDRHPNVPLADTIPQYRGPGMAQSPTWRDHRSHCGICTLWRPVSQSASLPVWQPARLTRIQEQQSKTMPERRPSASSPCSAPNRPQPSSFDAARQDSSISRLMQSSDALSTRAQSPPLLHRILHQRGPQTLFAQRQPILAHTLRESQPLPLKHIWTALGHPETRRFPNILLTFAEPKDASLQTPIGTHEL